MAKMKIFPIFILIMLMISLASAECTLIHKKKSNPDFYIFSNFSDKEAHRIDNLIKTYAPFKNYRFAYYYEKNLGDCSYLINCKSIPIRIDYLHTEYNGYTTAIGINNTVYQWIVLDPKYKDKYTVRHEFAHAIGDLEDLSRIRDSRETGKITLMHYGKKVFYLYPWQIEDLKQNFIKLKERCNEINS